MFGTIRKHQTWLWVIIIGVMVVSMAMFTQMTGSGNAQRRAGGARGEIDGKPITDTEFQSAWNEAALNYFMNRGEFPPETADTRNGWNQQQQAYERLFLIRKLDQYNIRADSDSVYKVASLFLNHIGRGEPYTLQDLQRRLDSQHMTVDDFQRFVEHYVAIQQLVSVIGAGGTLVPPAEIESLYVQGHQEVKVQAVVFSASNYLASIPEPTPAFLGQYYTNEIAKYREPDRMQVNYVHFNITNYLADAEQKIGTNINDEVEDNFHRAGTNVLSLGKTEAEQRAKLREYIIRGVALSNAYYLAISFQKDLPETPHTEDLNALAKKNGMEVKTSKPFDKEYGPSDLPLPPSFPVSELFNLTADDPFLATPLRTEDGVYVLALDKFIPSRVPPLDEIHSRVVADAKEFQATRDAQMSARLFGQSVTNGLARGQTFAEITSAAKVKPLNLAPFSANTENLPEIEDEVDLNQFKQSVIETPTGKASGLIPTRSGAMIVYVSERLPVDKAQMEAGLPNFGKMVRQSRENQAFDMWFAKEFNEAARYIPDLQRQGRS